MTALTTTLAILSTLSVIPTLVMWNVARRDRAIRRKAGINGALAALANHSVWRELVRIGKHGLMILAFWTWATGHSQPWINPLVCWLLAATSMKELHFRRWLENYIRQNRAKPPTPTDRPKG